MNRLKQLRLERGLLQSDIAKVINKTIKQILWKEKNNGYKVSKKSYN